MEFVVYDIALLVIFAVFVSVFLYRNRANLKKEGLLFLYKAVWGIKLINYIGKKYSKLLNVLSFVSIGMGYVLMVTMIYFLGKIVWVYLFFPEVVRAVKVPPIMPLIPYLPQAFKIDFLPPFYFTYWIVILAVIAISHEFAHGIFAAENKIKIKSTGFGFFPFFLPVLLAAFVELDEKKMARHKKVQQLAILSAGTFANIIVAVLFVFVLWEFFSVAFTPGGIKFDDYAFTAIPTANITMVKNISLINPNYSEVLQSLNGSSLSEINTNYRNYYGIKGFTSDGKYAYVYYNAPAIKNKIGQIITQLNGIEITSKEQFALELKKYSVGEKVGVSFIDKEVEEEVKVILEKSPESEMVWIGIGFFPQQRTGVLNSIIKMASSFKEPGIYYKPKWDGWSIFLYNLLWWMILISISVALMNMLPVGIFDGGRFFYLTILGITKSQKIAKIAFSFMTYLFLFLIAVLMFFWAKSFF